MRNGDGGGGGGVREELADNTVWAVEAKIVGEECAPGDGGVDGFEREVDSFLLGQWDLEGRRGDVGGGDEGEEEREEREVRNTSHWRKGRDGSEEEKEGAV